MKITLKNLQQQTFIIDIEPSKTVCNIFFKQKRIIYNPSIVGQRIKTENRAREGQRLSFRQPETDLCRLICATFFSCHDESPISLVGKILTDETALSEYNIDEKKFIVVMVTKPKQPEKTDSGDGNAATTATTTARLDSLLP